MNPQSRLRGLLLFTFMGHGALHAEVRVFTSATGIPFRGELVTVSGDTVTIRKDDGKVITTKASNLSPADIAYLKERALKDPASAAAGAPPVTASKETPFVNTLGMKFVPVPGTKVLMCIHETRRKDYATYALAVPRVDPTWKTPTANISGNKRPVPTGDSYPVEFTSWEDAHGFCAWLSKKEGRTYRLPTDREWSCAVGIGDRENATASPESLNNKIADVYPWGTQWPPPKGAGNYWDLSAVKEFHPKKTEQTRNWKGYLDGYGYEDGFPFSSPVMSFAPNELGIYDLGGNAYGDLCKTPVFEIQRSSWDIWRKDEGWKHRCIAVRGTDGRAAAMHIVCSYAAWGRRMAARRLRL